MKLRITPAVAAVLIAIYAITAAVWLVLVLAGKIDAVTSLGEIGKVLGAHAVGLGMGAYGVNLWKVKRPIEINGADSDPPPTPKTAGGA